MIVVITEDFEVYYELVTELRNRGIEFTTREPGDPIPDRATVVITDTDSSFSLPPDRDLPLIRAKASDPRGAVDAALDHLRPSEGRVIIGVDPGPRPGIAIVRNHEVVAAFQVPLEETTELIKRETKTSVDPLVRIGDGARLEGQQIINSLEHLPVELVDETGTTPHLGAGVRGVGDVLAAINIAQRVGEPIVEQDIEPTAGELERIKAETRNRSPTNRSIGDALARRVAIGELTIEEALERHKRSESSQDS